MTNYELRMTILIRGMVGPVVAVPKCRPFSNKWLDRSGCTYVSAIGNISHTLHFVFNFQLSIVN